jgi:hypothetical protein
LSLSLSPLLLLLLLPPPLVLVLPLVLLSLPPPVEVLEGGGVVVGLDALGVVEEPEEPEPGVVELAVLDAGAELLSPPGLALEEGGASEVGVDDGEEEVLDDPGPSDEESGGGALEVGGGDGGGEVGVEFEFESSGPEELVESRALRSGRGFARLIKPRWWTF